MAVAVGDGGVSFDRPVAIRYVLRMDFSTFFFGGTVIGILASLWGYIKIGFWRLVNLLIVRIRLQDQAGSAVAYYCWSNFKHSPLGEKQYDAFIAFVQPTGRNQVVGYEEAGRDFLIFWHGWCPLVLFMDYPPGNNGGMNPCAALTAIFLRGMFDADALVVEAIDRWNARQHTGDNKGRGRFTINRLFGHGPGLAKRMRGNERDEPKAVTSLNREEIPPNRRYLKWRLDQLGTSPGDVDPFSILALPENALDVVEKVRRWVKSEEWYKDKRIPWRMGLLFYGVPGTGKSSVARALGQHFDLPINIFDLSTFGNEDFSTEWTRVLSNTPCIMLIEDIDAVFNGRANRLGDGEGGLTFDCFLNCLSGVKEANGVLVIITTNHPEVLDEALGKPDRSRGETSTRPGRIDYTLELGPLDEACRQRIADRILADCPEHIPTIVDEGDGDTGAQFQNRCEQVALAEYWSRQDARQERQCAVPVEV